MGTSPLGNTGLALLFHDGPEKPLIFEAFESIPYLLNTVKTQSFAQMVKSVPAEVAQVTNIRGRFATMSTSEITPRFVNAVEEEVNVRTASPSHFCHLQAVIYQLTLWRRHLARLWPCTQPQASTMTLNLSVPTANLLLKAPTPITTHLYRQVFLSIRSLSRH